jgi:hypothetical protein
MAVEPQSSGSGCLAARTPNSDRLPSKRDLVDHGCLRGAGAVTLSVGLGISLLEKRIRPV